MRLDRNINPDGRGKYALIKLREIQPNFNPGLKKRAQEQKLGMVLDPKAVDFGDTPETNFFVLRLKDKHAYVALMAYAASARQDDPEYADDIRQLAKESLALQGRQPD